MRPHRALDRRLLTFPDGTVVPALVVAPDADPSGVALALDLPPHGGVVVLNGGTQPFEAREHEHVARTLRGVAAAVVARSLVVVSGGTDAGVFAVLGDVVASAQAMVGVAPLGAVRLPDGPAGGGDEVTLEPHHSHLVLVRGRRWGVETPMMLGLADALGDRVGGVAVLAGGGSGALAEVRGHVRAGRTVLVLAGSGRLADQIAEAAGGSDAPRGTGTSELQELAASPLVQIVPTGVSTETVAAVALRALDLSRSG